VSSVVDDVAHVGWIVTKLTLSSVLSYLSVSITLNQALDAANQRCFFTSSALYPIFRSVPNGGLTQWLPVDGSAAMIWPTALAPC
jgi:hypothetical protein